MNENGDLLPHGNIGEVVIRGANVTPGYRQNPEANAVAFAYPDPRLGEDIAVALVLRDGHTITETGTPS